MKNNKLIIFLIIVIGLAYSCKKETRDPVLDMGLSVAPSITNPQNGSTVILMKIQADSVLTFAWTPAEYNLPNLQNTIYSLQMDYADSSFSHPVELVNTTETSYQTTVGAVNVKLQNVFGAVPDENANFEYRVLSYLNTASDFSNMYSSVVTVGFTTYNTIIIMPPIFMLGSATLAGWDNTKALEMTYMDGGKYSIISTLTAGTGNQLKFISDLGAWAPQWGTDATGTGEAGSLVFRPTEAVPDPPGIPGPAVTGEYLIIADTANLTYTITLSSEIAPPPPIYMLGSATAAGWNNANALEMTYVSGGKFSIVATLTSGTDMFVKFISNLGAWAPQWGTDATGTSEGGPLVYRLTEAETDPPAIPAPSTTGEYLIEADTALMIYSITPR